MFITNILAEEQYARTQLAWMVQDHEWFCNAVTTVFKSCMGVTKKREILDKIADNFAVLQNRAIHSLECPTGVVVDKVVDEEGMRQSLMTCWSFYAKQGFCFDVNGLVRNDERMYRVAAPHLTQQGAQ